MHAQIISYQLKNISQADYEKQMVQMDAPVLAAVNGLFSKVWLSNPGENTYGGFYLWESQEHMQNFMASDLIKAVISRPFLTNIHSVDYAVAESPSRITRGLLAA